VIKTVLVTILTEGLVVVSYCVWRKKPISSILLTSISANLITQLLLWGILTFFFIHYLIALFMTEILIWIIESLALYLVPTNRLRFTEAISLSLGMNLVSFALGWILPI